MKKQTKNLFFGAILFAVSAFSVISCQSQNATNKNQTADNAQSSLDYEGIYFGTLPCADCDGIKTTVYINEKNTYKMVSVYTGKGEKQEETGSYAWDKTGSIIKLKSNKNSEVSQFFVGENTLTKLDQQGNKITGNLAAHYMLTKNNFALLNKKWKPIEIMGKPFVSKSEKASYLLFDAETSRYQAVTDCNSISGNFEILTLNRLKLSAGISTRMACPSMELEQQMADVLNQADGFIINGDELSLIKGRMAPLAKFKISVN